MKKKPILFSVFFLLISISSFAQTVPEKKNDVQVHSDSLNQIINVEFPAQATIYNLLVHLNDSAGNTLFLDNQYKFSGNYKRSINLKKQGRGTYYLEIIKDNEHINKKIKL